MTSWTIAKRITLVVAILCTLLLASGAIVWRSLTTISREATSISRDAIPGTVASAEISLFNLRHFIVVRTYLRAPKEQREGLKQEMDRFSGLVGARIKDYEATVTSQADRDLLKSVQQAREAFGAARQIYITAVESEQREEAVRMLDSELAPLLNKYNEATDKLFRFNADNGVAGGKAIVERAETTTRLVVLATGVAILLGIIVSFFIIRSTNGALTQIAAQLSTGSDETAAAAHEVSVSSHSLASGASEQAASLEETSASLEEISSMTKRNAENASKAKQIASATRDSAEKGATSMTEMNGAMGAINESATKIANIVKTIDEIAFQTNILALNAAVEAARAGEAGAGFAVVAEEVRRLAQRSATAAKETAALIEESVGRSAHGVQISGQVAQSFQHILEKAREVDALVAEIATASHEQHQGVGQVSIAVSEMDKVTQSTAANAEEAAAAAEELNSQSHLLRTMVGRLETLVGISHRPAALTERIAAPTAKAKPAAALPRVKSLGQHAPAVAPAATPVAEESFAEVA